MANRRRYKDLDQLFTKILLGDTAVFVLYLLFANAGMVALKVITSIVAIICSLLCLGFLYVSGETAKQRSRWMVYGFGAILVCIIVSLILKYPAPFPA